MTGKSSQWANSWGERELRSMGGRRVEVVVLNVGDFSFGQWASGVEYLNCSCCSPASSSAALLEGQRDGGMAQTRRGPLFIVPRWWFIMTTMTSTSLRSK